MAITILGKDVTNISIDEKEVIRISDYLTGDIIFEKVPVNYFYIQNTYSGTNTITITSTSDGNPSEDCFTRVIEYSRDRRIWTAVALAHQVQTTITLSQNDKVYFRNSNGKLNYDNTVDYFYTTFTASQSHIVGGNIESLVDYRNIGRINYRFQGTYSSLFRDNTTLTSASGLIMPENNLSAKCMSDMFRGCTALETAPELPAKTLSKSCYLRMFAECRSLTETPELPATSVQDGVYWSMFRNCTSLVTTHDLELKVLTNDCYNNMFYGCTSLVDAPEIYAQVYGKNSCENMFRSCTSLSSMHVNADDATATDCTKNWLANVAPSGTFYNYGSVIWDYPSPSGIPQGWREVIPENYMCIKNTYNGTNTVSVAFTNNKAQGEIPHVQTLQYSKDKINWNNIDCSTSGVEQIQLEKNERVFFRNDNGYFNNISTNASYIYFMLHFDCSNTYSVSGEISSLLDYENDNVNCKYYCFRGLFANSTTLTDASLLKLNVGLAESCFDRMFEGCSGLINTPSLPATTLASSCYVNMFAACTSLVNPPLLPATSLSYHCYAGMFSGCTSLTTIPSLNATSLGADCYGNMFSGCTSLRSVVLPSTVIGDCYWMFRNCSSLNYVEVYATSSTGGFNDWLYGVASTGIFYNKGTLNYAQNSASGIPTGWLEKTDSDYFYIENEYSGINTITFSTAQYIGDLYSHTECIEYSKDKMRWSTLTFVEGGSVSITLNYQGEKVYLRRDKTTYADSFNYYRTENGVTSIYKTSIYGSQDHSIGGNINSLLSRRIDFSNARILYGTFYSLFNGDVNLTDASNIDFGEKLDTSDSKRCYENMFSGCTALTAAPTLPSTNLASYCYKDMFKGCTSLVNAPELRADTIPSHGYQNMFKDCTSLNNVTVYADKYYTYAIQNWLDNVAATGTFHNLGSATYSTGASGIPSGWTIVNS